MDNQQERLLGWLGGIIDGEGSICIQCFTKKQNGNIRLTPMIAIVNTNLEILNQALKILDSMNVKKAQAEIMMRFIETRQNHLIKRSALGRLIRNGYSKNELNLYNTIKNLNGKESSETVWRAANYIGDDTVRTDMKVSEVIRN